MSDIIHEEPKEMKLSWFKRLLLVISPKMLIRQVARESGIDTDGFETMHDALARTKRVDLFPSGVNERGFIMVLDKRTAFFFYQNGQKFEYDGFEIGEYADGDITVMDHANKEHSPYEDEEEDGKKEVDG